MKIFVFDARLRLSAAPSFDLARDEAFSELKGVMLARLETHPFPADASATPRPA